MKELYGVWDSIDSLKLQVKQLKHYYQDHVLAIKAYEVQNEENKENLVTLLGIHNQYQKIQKDQQELRHENIKLAIELKEIHMEYEELLRDKAKSKINSCRISDDKSTPEEAKWFVKTAKVRNIKGNSIVDKNFVNSTGVINFRTFFIVNNTPKELFKDYNNYLTPEGLSINSIDESISSREEGIKNLLNNAKMNIGNATESSEISLLDVSSFDDLLAISGFTSEVNNGNSSGSSFSITTSNWEENRTIIDGSGSFIEVLRDSMIDLYLFQGTS